jgi:hypothetical protein
MIVIGRRNVFGSIVDIARHRSDFLIHPVVFKLLNRLLMKIRAVFRGVRIAVLAIIFALMLGAYFAPDMTAKIFKSGRESSRQPPPRPSIQSAPLRA